MPDLHITPDALEAHGRGCEDLAGKFDQLAGLLHQARVDDQCFGPIGQLIGLLNGYYETLDECRNQAQRAGEFLRGTKSALSETAKDHLENDRRIAEQLQAIGKELGA